MSITTVPFPATPQFVNDNTTVTNSDFRDGDFTIANTTDPTKTIQFSAANITTGSMRTITVPDSDLNLTTPEFTSATIGTGANTINIGTTNGVQYNGTTYRWDDVMVPGLTIKTRGSNDPSLREIASTGLYLYAFPDDAMREVYFQIQFPHSCVINGKVEPHIHWTQETTGTGNVIWNIDYIWADINSNFGTTATTISATSAGTTAWDHKMAVFSDLTGKSGVSSCMFGRLYRDGTADTLNGNAFLVSFDFHCEMDTQGSTDRHTK